MRKLHHGLGRFPCILAWFCYGLSALNGEPLFLYLMLQNMWVNYRKKSNRKALMRPGFSNYPYTKEYLCISLTSSVYLQTPALLLCKAGAGRLLQIKAFGSLLPPSTISKDFKPSVCRDKRNFVQLPANLGIWCWQVTRGRVFAGVFAHKNPLKHQRSGTTLSTAHPLHGPTPSPLHGLLLDPVHGL